MKHFIILSLIVTLVCGNPEFIEYKRTSMGDSFDKASMKILKETFQDAENNLTVPPLGALTLLSLYSTATEGKSRAEIMQLLGSTKYELLQEFYSNLTERFTSMDPSYTVLANTISTLSRTSSPISQADATKLN